MDKKFAKKQLENWSQAVNARSKNRADYYGGPKSGPGIYEIYKSKVSYFALKNPYAKFLILGATPELRDLVLSLNCELTVIDQSKNSIENMSEIMEYRRSKKETILEGNWLEMPFENESFDFVLGDAVSNNVKYAEHESFFREIARVLKPSGQILMREFFNNLSHERLPIKVIIQKFHEEKWHKFDFFFEFYLYNSDAGYMAKEKVIDMASNREFLIKNIFGKAYLSREEEDWLKPYIQNNIKSTFIPQTEFLESFQKFFNFVEIIKAKDFKFCDYFPFIYGEKTNG